MSDSLLGHGLGTETDSTPARDDTATQSNDFTPDVDTGSAPEIPEWVKGFEGHADLGEDILANPSLKALNSPTDLLKSYVNAQKMIGADKTVLPNKNSTPEEWLGLYHKLGMPTDFNGYQLEQGEKSVVNEEFFESFKKAAFENNLLPNQAQALLDMVNARSTQEFENAQEAQKLQQEEAITKLKQEWGEGFDRNVQAAKVAVDNFGGEELKAYLNETGLGNDPQLIKAFSKIGQDFLKEDTFEGESKSAYSMTPEEAQAQIGKITGDMDGAYYNGNHPDHKRIVNEVNKLYKML